LVEKFSTVFGKIATSPQGGIFFTHTVVYAILVHLCSIAFPGEIFILYAACHSRIMLNTQRSGFLAQAQHTKQLNFLKAKHYYDGKRLS